MALHEGGTCLGNHYRDCLHIQLLPVLKDARQLLAKVLPAEEHVSSIAVQGA